MISPETLFPCQDLRVLFNYLGARLHHAMSRGHRYPPVEFFSFSNELLVVLLLACASQSLAKL